MISKLKAKVLYLVNKKSLLLKKDRNKGRGI